MPAALSVSALPLTASLREINRALHFVVRFSDFLSRSSIPAASASNLFNIVNSLIQLKTRHFPLLQMSTDARSVAARLGESGFIKSQGFIGGKWTDAYDGKTIEVRNYNFKEI